MKTKLGPIKASIIAGFGVLLGPMSAQQGWAFSLGGGSDYAILFEGAGANTLQVTNVTINGNVGVGMTGKMTDSGPSTISGQVFFSAANTGQFSSNNAGNTFNGGQAAPPYQPTFNSAAVTNALNFLNAMNASLGAEAGTNVSILNSTTINGSAGTLDAGGNRVFNVTNFNTTNGDTLTINGDGHDIVFNITFGVNFNNQVVLNNISPDHVLFNFVGGSNLTGGPTLQINDNGNNHPTNLVQGVFLDPNGAISVVNTNLLGRVFGGDTHDMQVVSGDTISVPNTPDSGSTAMLMGLGFGLVAWAKRKLHSTNSSDKGEKGKCSSSSLVS